MDLYLAPTYETKILEITNIESTRSVVYINNKVIDDVQLARAFDSENLNLRVLELNLNENDIVSVMDNELVTYTIV